MFEDAKISKVKNAQLIGRRLGILIGCLIAVSIPFAFLIISLIHPIRHRAVLILLANAALPFVFWSVIRLTRLYKDKPWRKPKSDQTKVRNKWELSWGLFLFPIFLAGFGWGMLLLMTAVEEGLEQKKSWSRENLTVLTFFVFLPQIVLAYWCVFIGSPYLGLYLGSAIALSSFQLATGGLKLENGTLAFFGQYRAHASPMTVLSCGILFAAAFGVIHYGVGTLLPSEYAHMNGWQDALYFSVTTMATVGYGDISPVLHLARWLCIVEIGAGFTLLVVAVNASMSIWIQNHQPKQTPDADSVKQAMTDPSLQISPQARSPESSEVRSSD